LQGRGIDAVIFDLDGVITRTARVHARAWKGALDPLLEKRGQSPFDEQADYRRYVDGMARVDGARAFLGARGIIVTDQELRALCENKNALYLQILEADGVEVYQSSVAFVRELRRRGIRTGVVSASRNCSAVLRSAGALNLFDAKVDGIDAERLALAGKPAPDVFLYAAKLLGVAPARAAIVEDALAGVEAGRRGGFAVVVGVDRGAQAEALRARGATTVVRDLAELKAA